jgi:hypothetical protein
MDHALKGRRVSSPASTGGAGTLFEQHVGAYWLAQLLVRGIPPIIYDCTVAEVCLQNEHLGWYTDDFLIVGQSRSGNQRKLVGQVKRTFTVSATDEECKKAVQDFWNDFKSPDRFSPENDRFALVTLRGTNTLLEHFAALLDCSRAARDGAEFEHRLATDGFISTKAVHYCDEIRTIVGNIEGRVVTAAEIWPFLRVLHVLSLDLLTATRQTEAATKTLLAFTTGESDAIEVANTSWNALLAIVSDAMPEARRFRYEDLPNDLRERHSPLGGAAGQTLRALREHSALILRGIRLTLGGNLHLPRAALVQQVLGQLESTQVVLMSGPAGSGKSAIAKDAVALLSTEYFTFSFRAEEFAQPHFDATLQNAQIPANAATLGAILASQDRKVLLIESVERLLEKSTRDAFTDLLTLAAADKSWRIVLTCRDYSSDLVRASFLDLAPVEHSVITIPYLGDSELAEVERVHPTLVRPLANPALRRILRNPYFLDKALQISWSPERLVPESERELRELFWQQIVRADHRLSMGMPSRRGKAFAEIAVRRARALTLYITSDRLDPAVVDSLRHDSLLLNSEQNTGLIAPAHDVLEDWAILHWIEEQHAVREGSFQELSAAIGTQPAVRRSYRKWVAELVERDPSAADRLFEAAVAGQDVPAQFRDDTLVSLLRAPSSPAFLERQSTRLLENNKELLRRVIHLLRVACVTTPPWVSSSAHYGSLLNAPDGPAWPPVLRLVQTHIDGFASMDRPLLLGLIEDWCRGVSIWTPYPDGAEAVAPIAHWLLPKFDNYRSEDQLKRTLKVIAKIPTADTARFEALLRGTDEDDKRDRVGDDFRELIFVETEGVPAARDVPDTIGSLGTEYLLCSEDDLRQDWYHHRSLDIETLFGLKEGLRSDYFPASAYRGPFISLLRFHPSKGLEFIIRVFNHSADWYAHPRVSETVEPPFEIELKFADGTSRKQWGNERLWNWYRGTSVGPYALQSILMALERWLLEYAEVRPSELDDILVNILRQSDSAALTAVVASVASAHPHLSGEALLVLLSSPECIWLDRQRMVSESQAPSGLWKVMPLRQENRIYEIERKDADAKPHRRIDLEVAISNLQLGPFVTRVHEILDQNRAALPPISEQDDTHRAWRLAMHRIDLRQYVAAEAEAGDTVPSGESQQHQILLTPKEPDSDVKEMMSKNAVRLGAMNARFGLLMWGLQVFKHEESATHDPDNWREKLLQARTSDLAALDSEELDVGRGGPGIVAAVCVRDHWEEMSREERNWCFETVCSELMREADAWNYNVRLQRFEMSPDRACANCLPLLLGKSLTKAQRARVQKAFAMGLTHAIDEVRWYAAWGVADHLWSIDRELTLRCVNALATEASLVEKARQAEEGKRYDQRKQIDGIEAKAAAAVRRQFWRAGAIAEDAYETLNIAEWFGAAANARILTILGQAPGEDLTTGGFLRAAQTLVAWWDADDAEDDSRHDRNHDTETAISKLLQSYLMRTSSAAAEIVLQPILQAIDRHVKEIHWIIQGLTSTEDSQPNTPQFWFLWTLFAAKVRHAAWLADIDDEHPTGGEIISAIFLGPWWKDEVRHWKSLVGYAHYMHTLFEELPSSSTVFHDYVRFLYHIGEQSLPEAFVRVAKSLQLGDSQQMLKKTNTVFMLEALLQRYVYGKPLELKRERPIRDAVLFLLDTLVENGSAAAFRMRDDFVTPAVIA